MIAFSLDSSVELSLLVLTKTNTSGTVISITVGKSKQIDKGTCLTSVPIKHERGTLVNNIGLYLLLQISKDQYGKAPISY